MPENASKPVRFEDRVAWFQQARFGLFMHWGLYAMPAKYEWIRSTEKIPDDEYHRYAERFDPDKFDPRAWARLAREAVWATFRTPPVHSEHRFGQQNTELLVYSRNAPVEEEWAF